MRILHLDSGREMRGGQWQVLRLLEGLAAAGHENTLLVAAGSPLQDRVGQLGLDVRPFGWRSFATLARRADLIHAHDARSHTVGACFPSGPFVVSRRVAFPIRSRWKYSRADHYLAVSRFVKGVLMEGGVPEGRITVVYDGVPLLPPAAGGDGVLAPATADPQKGSSLAAEAARLAGVPIRFACDLISELPRAAIFVYLTYSEGLGSAVLLAMSAGVPIIASRVGGIPEAVIHGEHGLLTENDPAAVASAIRTLMSDSELARRLAANARRAAAERFGVDRMVRETISVYQGTLA